MVYHQRGRVGIYRTMNQWYYIIILYLMLYIIIIINSSNIINYDIAARKIVFIVVHVHIRFSQPRFYDVNTKRDRKKSKSSELYSRLSVCASTIEATYVYIFNCV